MSTLRQRLVKWVVSLDPLALSLLVHLVLPLFPLLFERWGHGSLSAASLTSATAIYAITIGVASRHQVLLALGLGIGVIFSFAAGAVIHAQSLPSVSTFALWAIALIFVTHLLERYRRHVINREPVLECMTRR